MDYKPLHHRADGGTAFILGDPRIDQQFHVLEADYTGATDATPAINAALATAAAARKLVFMKAGTLRLDTAVVPQSYTGLVGSGVGSTKLLPYGSESAIGTSSTSDRVEWVMRDFEIDGINAVAAGNGVTTKGAYFLRYQRVHIERLLIRNTHGTGLGIDHITGNIRDVWAIDCGSGTRSSSETTPGHSGIGIGTGGLNAEWEPLTIAHCHVVNARRFGIFTESQAADPVPHPSGLTIIGCTATACQDGFGAAGPVGQQFIGNHAYANRNSGIRVDHGTMDGKYSTDAFIHSNHVHDNGVDGIVLDTYGGQPMLRHVVQGNQVYGNGRHGITVSASASGTAWGLVNGVTEFIDHHRRARSEDHRRDAAWFGAGAAVKQKAWDEAMKLVA